MKKQLDSSRAVVVRGTDYNRFRTKSSRQRATVRMGWNATIRSENFFFLLYGPNKKVGSGGENAANYDRAESIICSSR